MSAQPPLVGRRLNAPGGRGEIKSGHISQISRRAEGFALALSMIFAEARNVDSKTMSLQYLEALKTLGAGPATKFVLPMEFTNLLRPFVDHIDPAANGKSGVDPSQPSRSPARDAGRRGGVAVRPGHADPGADPGVVEPGLPSAQGPIERRRT